MNAATANEAIAGAAAANRRILVVEDHEDNRQILRDLLSSRGYDLVEAEDGERALAMAEDWRPALILMDVQIPLIDGYEVTRRLKANPDLRAIPVIAVTSYALSGDESKARAAGCNAYVSKPYSARKLLAKVQEYVP
jgi:two-component system cell cycle response regulator DivK